MASGTDQATLDWTRAEVRDRRLTVPFGEKVAKEWTRAAQDVLDRLAAGREVEVGREAFALDVEPGDEGDVRHLLESAVLEVNARLGEDDDEDETSSGDPADAAMTEAFRAFGERSPGDA